MSNQFKKGNDIFQLAALYGCDEILVEKLQLDLRPPLPIAIPHGIDHFHLTVDSDLFTREPVYMAFREDIAERVRPYKTVLKFPHPWLLIVTGDEAPKTEGTLFIAPPPSRQHFETMLARIREGDYPRPWGILMKERGIVAEDFQWWRAAGFAVHTAGSIHNPRFFYNLRDIMIEYGSVAAPNMSSAVIFAASINRRTFALPDVPIYCVDTAEWKAISNLDDADGRILRAWQELLSGDLARAREQANFFLGRPYLASRTELRERLQRAVASVADDPVYLYRGGSRSLHKVFVWLIRRGVPVYKLFPRPFARIRGKLLSFLGLNQLTTINGSDFSHYGVRGSPTKFEIKKVFAFQLGASARPGFAVRAKSNQEVES